MERLHVVTESKSYDIVFRASFDNLLEEILDLKKCFSKIGIITDQTVGGLYAQEIENQLKPHFHEVFTCFFEAGESNKHLNTVSELYEFMLENKLDRKSLLIALGGGVTGDMAGFAAATFMRGISFIQIPTSLLAQVDSSIGGKTAVDFHGHKNLIGAFYQPELVYINTSTLKTLPKKELISGMGEVIKHGIIADPEYLELLRNNCNSILSLEHESITKVIYGSCKIKCSVVNQDEREEGIRALLNFGHTAGHAIERLMDFKLSHGECVAIGMIVALEISFRLGHISSSQLDDCINIIKSFGLPTKVQSLQEEKIYAEMFVDKKTSHNQISYILVSKIGQAIIHNALTKEIILQGIHAVMMEECNE